MVDDYDYQNSQDYKDFDCFDGLNIKMKIERLL